MKQKTFDKLSAKLETGSVFSRRNVAQRFAQTREPMAVGVLIKAVGDSDQIVQMNAIQGLSAIGTPEAVSFLQSRGIEVAGGKPVFSGAAATENALRVMKSARVNMGLGGAILAAGVAITAGTYAAASDGGTYYVTYGLMIIGAVDLAYGIYQYLKAKKSPA